LDVSEKNDFILISAIAILIWKKMIKQRVLMSVRLQEIARRLDARAFLDFRIWNFSLLNTGRFFPWYYFFRIFLLHPITAFSGLLRYRRLIRRAGTQSEGTCTLEEAVRSLRDGGSFLLAPGFCMKPFDFEIKRSTCPAGHFNHSCILMDNAPDMLFSPDTWPQPCLSCGIAPIARMAAINNTDLYIMTSAIDIACDVYLPAIRKRQLLSGIFFICSYSVDPFTFGLAVSGIKGAIVKFCSGDCSTHEDWTNADIGVKNDQTFLEPHLWGKLQDLIGEKSGSSECADRPSYSKKGHVYKFMAASDVSEMEE
jgi:hypothetical protein